MDNWEITLVETEARSKSNTHRINELAREHEAIHELAISVKEIAVNTQAIQRELTQQGAKIEALEKEIAANKVTFKAEYAKLKQAK